MTRDMFDYSQRAQWLRAIVLGGNEGLVATSVFVMAFGINFKNEREKDAFIVTCLIGLVAGALNMAVAEFVSVCAQADIIKSQEHRDQRSGRKEFMERSNNIAVPSATQVAVAASLAYAFAGSFQLLVVHVTGGDYKTRFAVVAAVAALSMLGLGKAAALLGKAPILRSCVRVLAGGCLEILILLGKKQLLDKLNSHDMRRR